MFDDDEQSSIFRMYKGVVAEPRERNSPTIHVIVNELSPNLRGAIGKVTEDSSVSVDNLFGTPVTKTASVTNTITAIWLGDSNRHDPPDVQKGEQVRVWRFGDADKWYWESYGRDSDLRKKEVFRLEVANKNSAKETLTDDNTYFIELNTYEKAITLATSQNDGENFKYVCQMDATNDRAFLGDNVGNALSLDSKNTKVILRNKDGAALSLDKRNIILEAPDDILFKAGRQAAFATPCVTFAHTKGDGVCVLNAQAANFTVQNVVWNVDTFCINGLTKLNGDVISGNIRATAYTTGALGSGYSGATINTNTGKGTKPSTPSESVDSNSGRHGAAWEEVRSALLTIKGALDQIKAQIGVPNGHESIITDAEAAIMSLNRGD